MGAGLHKKTSDGSFNWRGPGLVTALVLVVALGGVAAAVAIRANRTRADSADGNGSQSSTTTTVPPTPLTITSVSPTPGTANASFDTSVTVNFSEPLTPNSPFPRLSPAPPGKWVRTAPTTVRFVPEGYFVPFATVQISVPGGPAGIHSRYGQSLSTTLRNHFGIQGASELRLQQLLAELDYLPVKFVPAAPAAPPPSPPATDPHLVGAHTSTSINGGKAATATNSGEVAADTSTTSTTTAASTTTAPNTPAATTTTTVPNAPAATTTAAPTTSTGSTTSTTQVTPAVSTTSSTDPTSTVPTSTVPTTSTTVPTTSSTVATTSTTTTTTIPPRPQLAVDTEPAVAADVPVLPAAGTFVWRFPNLPASLTSLWKPGQPNVITTGAVMAFEAAHNLKWDGIAGPEVWAALLEAVAHRQVTTAPYDYVSVSEALPESATVWRNGQDIFTTPVNTGIPAEPTAVGTYPVYARYLVTTMKGKNPDGTPYSDPGIPWVSYFNGGDALHGYIRASYGFPQSLGCVEMTYANAATMFPLTPIGTLVTVLPS